MTTLIKKVQLIGLMLLVSGRSYGDSARQQLSKPMMNMQQVFDFHTITFYLAIIISLFVIAALFYALIRFRRSQGNKAKHFHLNLGVEILWTAIPLIILVGLAVPAFIMIVNLDHGQKSELVIKATAHANGWRYDYVGQNISYFSQTLANKINHKGKCLTIVDHPLVLPVDRSVKLIATSQRSNYRWEVPQLKLKLDAVPGLRNQAVLRIEKTGFYRNKCLNKALGQQAQPAINVEAVSAQAFQAWLKNKLNESKIKHSNER